MKTTTLITVLTPMLVLPSFGAIMALDVAANYDSGWSDGENKGSGYGAWDIDITGDATSTVDSTDGQNALLSSDAFVLVTGASGIIDAENGNTTGNIGTATATRNFSSAMVAGDVFSMDFAHGSTIHNAAEEPGEIGINLLSGTTTVFTLKFVGGGFDWVYNDASNASYTEIHSYDPNTSIKFEFTYLEDNLYTFTFDNASSSEQINGGVGSGIISSEITGFELFNIGTTPANAFKQSIAANNIQLSPVPEPATYALLTGILGMALVATRRRRG